MTPSPDTVRLQLRVQPGAKREGIVGNYGDAVKVAIAAPAVDGKANDALIRLLASLLEVPRSHIEIVAGHTSRSKVVRIAGVAVEQLRQKLPAGIRYNGS